MKLGLRVAIGFVLALSACGADEEQQSTSKTSSATATASPDPGTKAEAQKVLDKAYDRFIAESTGRYRSTVELAGSKLVAEGRFDIDAKRGAWRLVQPSLGRDGAEDGEFAMRGMAIDRHVYGGPEFGPFQKCWFDYGTSGVAAVQGLGEPDDPSPWYQAAMIVPTESRALGFVDGRRDVIAVEVFADTALSVIFNKLLLQVYDQLPKEQVWSPATVTLKDGQFSQVTYKLGDALEALEDAGVDFASVQDAEQTVDVLRSATETTTLDPYGVPVEIQAPPADELMDATDLTRESPSDPELCAAAR